MPTLVVQRGHCYRRTGATGTTGEQAYASAVANACLNLLHGRGGWAVRTILADDAAHLYRGDAFVAIHCDGSTNSSARGASIGYRTPEGQRFGQAWKRAYARRGWTGFRSDNYTPALQGYYGTGTAVAVGNRRAFIAECGFLTNPQDRARLTGTDGPARVALAIGDALGIQPTPEENFMSALTDQQQKDLFHRVDYHIPTWIAEIKAELAEVRSYVRPGHNWSVQDGWLQGALSNTNTQLPEARNELAELSAKVDQLAEAVAAIASLMAKEDS